MVMVLDSVLNARKLRAHAEVMLQESQLARQHYIQGLQMLVGDEELRHRHHDAMDANVKAVRAHNATLGAKSYQYQDRIG